MKYRFLGNTNLKVSEIAFGAEWLEGKSTDDAIELISYCESQGINLIDCWMSEPNVRSNIGIAIKNSREKWIIQGHIGSIWENNQYCKTRDLKKVKIAFKDLMNRLGVTYIDLGMIHYVDDVNEFIEIMEGEFINYVKDLKNQGLINYIGLSTHNTDVALKATEFSEIELIMFSVNPAFDMLPSLVLDEIRAEGAFDNDLNGIDPKRAYLYQVCDEKNIPITVMKGFAGGTLFNKNTSPFNTVLTPVQCIEYALSRPGVKSILVGVENVYQMRESLKYEIASDKQKDYSQVLINAPLHSFNGQCTYCGHCLPCTTEINIAIVNKYYDLAKGNFSKSIKAHYDELWSNASDCIKCGDCESRCPFNVNIMENMDKINDFFRGF